MTTLMISINDEMLAELSKSASDKGVTIEDYARESLAISLSRRAEWDEIKRYLLTKNAELYRRLA